MSVLLLAEVAGGKLVADATGKAVSAVKALGEVSVLVAGENVSEAAAEAGTLDGVARVLSADGPAYAHGLAEPLSELVASLAGDYDHVAAPATTASKNVMPRVAALIDVMVISDVVEIIDSETFVRPIYAGNVLQTVRSSDARKVLTIRASSYDAAGTQEAAPVETVAAGAASGQSEWIADQVAGSDRPDLTSARVVVSGGRGLGSQENFAMIETLADKLGAAIGASRAAVDAGYAPNDLQVGQTGKIVAPDLYVAVGISGAIQHLAGMKDSRVIVAINKDADAPIFQIADYGLVADLFEAIPELVAKL